MKSDIDARLLSRPREPMRVISMPSEESRVFDAFLDGGSDVDVCSQRFEMPEAVAGPAHSPLEVVGNINVSGSVEEHRFVREALGAAIILGRDDRGAPERVVGTANTGSVELYGWAAHVAEHADKTGYVYLCALSPGKTSVNVWLHSGEVLTVFLPVGAVVRLNDWFTHWTEDDSARVCVFVGSYEDPCDDVAIALLQEAIGKLAAGDYYGAPRVREGFRALLDDECLVPNAAWDACEPALLADQVGPRAYFERCAHCERPAVRLDNHWPYFAETNRCSRHLLTGEAEEPST